MQVKIFEADDMRSALEKVKKALGPEALILSTRNVLRKNRFGFPGKTVIEVTAAIDGNMASVPAHTVKQHNRESHNGNAGIAPVQPVETPRAIKSYSNNGVFEDFLKAPKPKVIGQNDAAPDENLIMEIRDMRRSLTEFSRQFSQVRWGLATDWASSFPSAKNHVFSSVDPETLLTQLQASGMDNAVIQMFFEEISDPDGSAVDLLASFIASKVNTNDLLSSLSKGKKRVAFIGPTGVGKTTTLAKVAANYLLEHGGNIALATMDNYRIAAAEQLKIYGRIMNIPVDVARTPAQLAAIFSRHQDKDLILVDTAGRSPKDEMSLRELSDFLDPALGIENHLVLSATTRECDLFSTINRFEQLPLEGVIFTKTDECELLGSILNVIIQAGNPLSLLTNGQRVPEDFLPPAPRQLADMVLTNDEVGKQWNTEESRIRRERFAH